MPGTKPQGGRPSKLTPEVQDRIITAIRAGNYSRVAAEYAGISERTFYGWLRRGKKAKSGLYREFWCAVQRAEREAEVRAVAMIQKSMDGNWRAALAFLERKYPSRWGRKDRLSIEVEPREALAELLGLDLDQVDEAVDVAAAGGGDG
ncbi:MAG: hypothetical protein AAGM22_27405 [Acidobacteriota bacterium]